MQYAIETINLSKSFPVSKSFPQIIAHPFKKEKKTVLLNINLHVKQGELFCLLGPNGAGKTTLIKILSSLILPSSGKALVNGFNVVTDNKSVRRSIGLVVSDERSFYWRLTGKQNLRFFATLNNLSKVTYETRIESVLGLLDLHKEANKPFKNYSTGTRQKFAIARGLLTNPKILIMDEPTRSLDRSTSQDLKKLIKEKIVGEEKNTVLLTTHNIYEAEELADRVGIIHQGEIKTIGALQQIRNTINLEKIYKISVENSDTQFKHIIESANFKDSVSFHNVENGIWAIQIKNGKVGISDIISQIVSFNGRILECTHQKPDLSKIYDRIVQ